MSHVKKSVHWQKWAICQAAHFHGNLDHRTLTNRVRSKDCPCMPQGLRIGGTVCICSSEHEKREVQQAAHSLRGVSLLDWGRIL
mmetsp:Transcript_133834/g.231438  ORF Transcript_133834/g.231438 Transcript_133834/m.231438 type:complete len:84 (-) Transcript_133834:14-265(-)